MFNNVYDTMHMAGGGDPIIAWVVFIVGPIVSKGYVWEEYVVYSHRISTARKVKGWGATLHPSN